MDSRIDPEIEKVIMEILGGQLGGRFVEQCGGERTKKNFMGLVDKSENGEPRMRLRVSDVVFIGSYMMSIQ